MVKPIKRHIPLMILLLLIYCGLKAQQKSHSIRGRITDSHTSETLSNATISLIRLPDSVTVNKSVSNKHGFMLTARPGKYNLRVSYIGYRDSIISITVHEEDSTLNIGTLFLQQVSEELVQVIVKAILPPIIIKNDTISYNTAAYPTRPNAPIEELLRKLPGVEVDKDGNITVHGKKVQKVYLDGKEFFFNDPSLASKNLPADLVEKIEAFDEKSERSKLTGIPDNHAAKVINLRFKQEKKKGIFGNIFGGYGSEDRYSLKTSANYFKGNRYLSGMLNSSKGGSLDNDASLLNTKNQATSINYRDNLTEKLGIGLALSVRSSDNLNTANNVRKTFLSDSSLVMENRSVTSNTNNNQALNLNLDYEVDSFNKVHISISVMARQRKNNQVSSANSKVAKETNLFPTNDAVNMLKQNMKGFNETIGINYHHRFRKQGRYFGINMDNGSSQDSDHGNQTSVTRFYKGNGVPTDSLIRNQQSVQPGNAVNFNVDITYTEPAGRGRVFDFSYTLNHSYNHTDQQTFNYNYATGEYDTPDSLTTNNFKGVYHNQQLSMGYNYFKDKLQIRFGLSVQTNKLQNRNSTSGTNKINQQTNTIFASGYCTYRISKQKNLEINYNGNTHQPSVEQLQPVMDYSNPLLLRLGNPGLKPEFANSANVRYRNINDKGNVLFYNFNYSNIFNKIASTTYNTSQGIQQQQYVNTRGNYSINTNASYSFPFLLKAGQGKGNITIASNLSFNQNITFVNEKKNKTRSISWGQQLQSNYHYSERLFAEFSTAFNWNHSTYSIQNAQGTSFFSHNYYGNIFYELPIGLALSTNINLQFQHNQQNLPVQSRAVWNAILSKSLFANRAGELKLTIFDLLNNNNNFTQVTADNYIETNTTEVVKQVFVLSFLYRFRLIKR
jgi:hypothetical protein